MPFTFQSERDLMKSPLNLLPQPTSAYFAKTNMPLTKRTPLPITFAPSRDAMRATGMGGDKLRQLRRDGILQERIHWVTIPGSTNILWNVPLILDWLVNGSSPSHQRAIERFVSSLASSEAA